MQVYVVVPPPPVLPQSVQLVRSAQDFIAPVVGSLILGIFHVIGGLPVALHVDLHVASHVLLASVSVAILPIDPPNIVITTSAVIKITIAETTMVRVMFIKSPYPLHAGT